MSHILEDFISFLENAPTSLHAVKELSDRLATKDFTPLSEDDPWKLELGNSYFVARGGSLCAFSLPKKKPTRALILGSHTDSPALKLKPNPEFSKENSQFLGIEVYGGPLLSSWLGRDLGIAGRVIVTNDQDETEERLCFIDDAPLFIPQLAIHLDRDVNEKGLILNKQEHLNPLASLYPEKDYLERILRTQFSFKSLLSFDLFLVPLEKPRFLGPQSELLAAYRLDNLASAHAAVTALASSKKTGSALQMAIFWDNEEVGSRTAEGAGSSFLQDIFKRISHALDLHEETFLRWKKQSLCVSVDMAHAYNPSYPQKHDPRHQPLLGKGIVIKYNADQKYATTAATAAPLIRICQKLYLPYQNFASRSDMPCGSTIGPIVATTLGIPTVDIGAPLLAMHSIRELMACQDHLDMCRILTHLLEEG